MRNSHGAQCIEPAKSEVGASSHRGTGTTTTRQRLLQDCLALARKRAQTSLRSSLTLSCPSTVFACGVWGQSLRYPTYGQSSISDQASGPPLTRILSVGADRKHHAELQVNRPPSWCLLWIVRCKPAHRPAPRCIQLQPFLLARMQASASQSASITEPHSMDSVPRTCFLWNACRPFRFHSTHSPSGTSFTLFVYSTGGCCVPSALALPRLVLIPHVRHSFQNLLCCHIRSRSPL